ncbi:MAG: TonB-dependent receptor [Sphingomonas bacterium]|nr:TonB-dependent receptor [Sphingomonas bacterium]
MPLLIATLGTLAAADEAIAVDDAPAQITVIGQPITKLRSATKTDSALQDVPQAVSVVSKQRIDDQAMRSISDVMRLVPGASVASGEGHRDTIILRGQNSTADFFVDGLRDDVQYYRGLYNLDRIEVLKGPNALIFGRGGGGGVVNRVTKKADGSRALGGVFSVDSHGAFVTAVDLQAPLTDDLSGRVNAVYETFDSFRNHVDGRRIGVNPTLGWQAGNNTRIDLAYEYANDSRVVDRGIPSRNGRPLKGAHDQFFGDPDVNRLRFDAHVGDVAVEHRFGDALRWSAKARLGAYDKFYRNSLAAGPATDAGTVAIEAYQSRTTRDSLLVQNDFVASLTTGPVAHTLLFGVDFSSQDSFSERQEGFFNAAGTILRISVPLASSDKLPPIFFRDSAVRRASAVDSDARSIGLYVQDQARIGDHVEIIAGLRRDWFRLDTHNRVSGADVGRKDSTWSPRLGLVVKPMPSLSLYASWSKSFLPQSGDQFSNLTPSLAALAPEKFGNREIGLKWAATPAIDVTLAGYILERSNTRAVDPVTRLTVLTGEQRSKGIEASAEGRVMRGLSFTAAAALQEARITRTTAAAAAGIRVPSVPTFTGSLWGRYDVSDRLGLGLGLYHQSKAYASVSNKVTVPGFTRIDAAAFIGLTDQLKLQLNLENVANKKYIGLTHNDNNLTPANPRTVRAALRIAL